jgi:hypothetical protein
MKGAPVEALRETFPRQNHPWVRSISVSSKVELRFGQSQQSSAIVGSLPRGVDLEAFDAEGSVRSDRSFPLASPALAAQNDAGD